MGPRKMVQSCTARGRRPSQDQLPRTKGVLLAALWMRVCEGSSLGATRCRNRGAGRVRVRKPGPHLGSSNVSLALMVVGRKDRSKDRWSPKLWALYLAKCASFPRRTCSNAPLSASGASEGPSWAGAQGISQPPGLGVGPAEPGAGSGPEDHGLLPTIGWLSAPWCGALASAWLPLGAGLQDLLLPPTADAASDELSAGPAAMWGAVLPAWACAGCPGFSGGDGSWFFPAWALCPQGRLSAGLALCPRACSGTFPVH